MMHTNTQRRAALGLSLVELLVSLAIGTFLIAGAVTVYSRSRSTFTVNEQNARLQETGRFVLALIEPEVQLAGLYGYTNEPSEFVFRAAGADTPIVSTRQDDPAYAPIGAAAHSCGSNFAIDLLQPVGGTNDGAWPYGCAPEGAGAVGGTDTLVLRRADTVVALPDATRIQVYGNRLIGSKLFLNNVSPGPITPDISEIRNLIVRMYYVAAQSDANPAVPALRAKTLGAGPAFFDQEIIRGVEDIQFEFGIDPGRDTNGDGVPDDADANGIADSVSGLTTRYVEPGDPAIDSGLVTAVRVWVRVRSETPEPGFVNDRRFQYASVDFTPNDGFRRVLVSRTFFLRNSRQGSGNG
jgi:type IV pilus assembly protein PilW